MKFGVEVCLSRFHGTGCLETDMTRKSSGRSGRDTGGMAHTSHFEWTSISLLQREHGPDSKSSSFGPIVRENGL
jgi:hypothetical protein